MIRLAIIASVCMAMTYGQNLNYLHRLEPLFRPANVLKGVRGGNYAVDGSPGGGASIGARGDESSSETDGKIQRDSGNEEVIVIDPNAECGAYIPMEIREAYRKRNRTTPGSAVTKNEEQSDDNHNIRYLVTIVETTFVERENGTIGQIDKGNDSKKMKRKKEVEVLRQCIGVLVTQHFILTTTNCCTECLPISQGQTKKGKKERNSELSRRQRNNNKRQQKDLENISQYINLKVEGIVIIQGLFKISIHGINEDKLPKGLRPKRIHIPSKCAERMRSSREEGNGTADYPVECPVLMELNISVNQEITMPICLPVHETFDLHTQMIVSIGLGKKQGWQKKPRTLTEISKVNSFECERMTGFKKLPEDTFCTQSEASLFEGNEGAPLVVYSPKGIDYEEKITGIALLVRSGFKDDSEELPGSEENDEGKNSVKTDMKDKGSREAIQRQNVHIWLSIDYYIDWIIETAFAINQFTLPK